MKLTHKIRLAMLLFTVGLFLLIQRSSVSADSGLDIPVVTLANAETGIQVTWGKITNAESYLVYRKTTAEGQSYVSIASVSGTSYLDTQVVPGESYYYTVRAVNASGKSSYKTPGAIIRLTQPEVSISATATGASITWNKIAGAEYYKVYRKSYSGNYTVIDEVTTTKYTDNTADANTSYYYTVRAAKKIKNTEVKSSYQPGLLRLACPQPSVSNTASGIKVSWTKVSGANKYRVYRKTSSSSWSRIAETTSVNYTDKAAEEGTVYYYTVRAMKDLLLGSYTSSGLIIRLAQPEISLAGTAKGASVNWSAVAGADYYRVYRKTYSGSYSKLADVTGTSYTDTKAVSDVTYYYTVRAMKTVEGTENKSSYHSGLIRLGMPVVTVSNASSGVKVAWEAIEGAEKYRVYRKTTDTGAKWENLGETTSLSYTDKNAASGTTYYYTVRSMASGLMSTYTSSDVIMYLKKPAATAQHALKGTKVTWKKIEGAAFYRVYRKTEEGSFAKLKDVTGTSYTDTTGVTGTEYAYTVRAFNGDFKSAYTATDYIGWSIPYILDASFEGSGSSKKGIQCGDALEAVGAYNGVDYNIENVYLHLNICDLITTQVYGDPLYTNEGINYYYKPDRAARLASTISMYKENYGGQTATVVFVSSQIIPGLTYTATGAPEGVQIAYYGINVTDATCKKNVQALINKVANDMGSVVDNWVIGNEINCPVIYNYCENIGKDAYINNYFTLLSMMHKTMAKKNSDVRSLIPIDQGWTHGQRNDDPYHPFTSKEILETIHVKSKSNDFNWGVALHPYSYDLKDSNWWDDSEKHPEAITFSENTDMYSMDNIEVITSYIANNWKYNGKSRYIAITEVGFNAAVNGILKLEQQAASLAYAYYKAEADPNIRLFIYNATIDGWDPLYLFGIQKDYNNKRPAYYAFYFMDTPLGTEITKPYLSVLGKKSWSDLIPSYDKNKYNFQRKISLKKDNSTTYSVLLGNNSYFTGFILYNGQNYYCQKGQIDLSFTGKSQLIFGVTYDIVNGVLQLS